MPKLIQLNSTANWGSTGKIAEGIGMAAMNNGWESHIAYGRYMNPSNSELVKVGNKLDIYSHYFRARFLDGEGLGSKRATQDLINEIIHHNPDIIQLHNIHDHWLNYPLLFKFLDTIDTPIVWTFHDCWAFTGGCAHFEYNECFKWRNHNCNQCCFGHSNSSNNFNLKKASLSTIGKRLHIVSVSQWLSNYVRQSFISNITNNFQVINNGIDINGVFTPGGQKEQLVIGVSNVWTESKGFNDFIKLRRILPQSIKIVLVGLTSKQIKSMPDGIYGIERTESAAELAHLYRSARVFVNPTYNDSFPTVNLEALACGTPVVTYRTGGSPEAIDERTGIVVEKGDIEDLASSIKIVIDNPGKFSSENCHQHAVSHFNKDIQFGKYIDLYEYLLKN